MKSYLQGLTLRIDDPKYNKRVLEVIQTGWHHKGMTCVLKHSVSTMEAKPSKIIVDYLVKLFQGDQVSYPSIREASGLVNTGGQDVLEIDGRKQTLDEWRTNKKEAMDLLRSLKDW